MNARKLYAYLFVWMTIHTQYMMHQFRIWIRTRYNCDRHHV